MCQETAESSEMVRGPDTPDTPGASGRSIGPVFSLNQDKAAELRPRVCGNVAYGEC